MTCSGRRPADDRPDPFTALGLPARPDLTDEQVRAAWRAIAAATHPDRPGGGNPARLRRRLRRVRRAAHPVGTVGGIRRPDRPAPRPPPPAGPAQARPGPAAGLARSLLLVPARIRHGRPLRLLPRILAAVAAGRGRGPVGCGRPGRGRRGRRAGGLARPDRRGRTWPRPRAGEGLIRAEGGARAGARRVVLYPPGMGRGPKSGRPGRAKSGQAGAARPAPARVWPPALPAHARTPAKTRSSWRKSWPPAVFLCSPPMSRSTWKASTRPRS